MFVPVTGTVKDVNKIVVCVEDIELPRVNDCPDAVKNDIYIIV